MTNTGIVRITKQYLNSVDDVQPGQIQDTGPAYGQVGETITLNADDALKLSNNAVGTLYAGVYQYVRFASEGVLGKAAFWSDPDNFVVTPDPTGIGFAGVSLNTVTPGNYGWILVEGKVKVMGTSAITASAPAVGDDLALDLSTGFFDDFADDGGSPPAPVAFDGETARLFVGQWLEVPAADTLKLANISAAIKFVGVGGIYNPSIVD